MNPFFDEAGALLASAAQERGVTIDPPKLDPKIADELLEFSRVVAHTRERRFAPLSTYMAGIAAGSILAKQPQFDVVAYLKAVRDVLETQEGSASSSR
ncbi:MAG: hypothetical protein JO349_05810 [Candidatus Eremiobacteraeota bacterium]|nr:hypothetical protein [Candidatus Eremiobacteraeota bacterium]